MEERVSVRRSPWAVLVWLVFLGLPAVVLAVVIYWMFFEPPVLKPDVKNPWVLTLDSLVVAPGNPLIGTFYSCKTSNLNGTWSRSLIDTVEWNLVSDRSRLPMGCGYHAIVQVIPAAVPDGAYRLALAVEYNVNPLSTQHFQFISPVFHVKRPTPAIVGDVPAPRPLLVVPEWNANRDREFRERLHQLELFRYRVEGKVK